MHNKKEYKAARQFIKTHNIKELSRENLEKAIKSQGHSIIYFGNEQNSKSMLKFSKCAGVKDKLKAGTSFTYHDQTTYTIFIPDNFSDEEIKISLCREAGYIIMSGNFPDEEKQSILLYQSAAEFVHYLKELTQNSIKSRLLKNPLTFTISAIFSSLLIFCVSIMLAFSVGTAYDNSNQSSGFIPYSNSQSENFFKNDIVASSVTNNNSVNVDELFDSVSTHQDSDAQVSNAKQTTQSFFYVTKSGKKYHEITCSYVEGKDNLIEIQKDDIDTSKYEPCSKCIK